MKEVINIAYLSDSDLPSTRANTVHVLKMCSELNNDCYNITLFCNKYEEFEKKTLLKKYNIFKDFKIFAVESRLNGKAKLLDYAFKKAKNVRNGDYDFCYGRSLLTLFLLRRKKPFIYESHIFPNRKIFFQLEKKLLKSKNMVKLVVISTSLKKKYLESFPFLSDNQIVVLHDGADKVDFNSISCEFVDKRLIEYHNKNLTIGYIGHLYPGKCMEIVIEIAKKMKSHVFHIVGGTDEWVDYWKKQCESIENVYFYGFIDNSLVNSYYSLLDVVILPFSSKIFYNKDKKDDIGQWISPLKLFEAMANNKCIISSKLPSIEEVISDGINGLLVEPNDYEKWVFEINRCLMDPNLRLYMGNNARQLFEAKYTWKNRASEIQKLIKHHLECVDKNE